MSGNINEKYQQWLKSSSGHRGVSMAAYHQYGMWHQLAYCRKYRNRKMAAMT